MSHARSFWFLTALVLLTASGAAANHLLPVEPIFPGSNHTHENHFEHNHAGQNLGSTNLSFASFKDADLSAAYLGSSVLVGTIVLNANLTDANLQFVLGLTDTQLQSAASVTGITLALVSLTGFNLASLDLTGADLTGAFLNSANLTLAKLTFTDLTGADLTGAFLDSANLESVVGLTDTQLQSAASVTGITLAGLNLAGFNLASLDLTGAIVQNANLTGANLNSADLNSADLTGAHLTAADLTGASFLAANLSNADLRDANLANAEHLASTISGPGTLYSPSTDFAGTGFDPVGAGWTLVTPPIAVTWETGTVSGTVTGGGTTGSFAFDPGSNDLPGVDYSLANPGTFSVATAGSQGGTWSGSFSASNVVFGVTSGSYWHSTIPVVNGGTLALDGPLNFNATPPLPELMGLAFSAQTTVSNVLRDFFGNLLSYDFSGPFQMKACAAGPDSDTDGLSDCLETEVHGTNPALPDTDGDGLSDGDEVNIYATDPLDPDSDDDGFTDGVEVAAGSDPNDQFSTPVAVPSLSARGILVLGLLVTVAGAVSLRKYAAEQTL